jgi:hypothetical protein
MSAIHHFLIKENKIHHLDTVNISELQSEHPCGCLPSPTFVDLLCTQIRYQNRIRIWIRTRSQGVCDSWLKWALIIIWGCAMVPLLSLLLVIAPAFWRLNFTVNVSIRFIPHKNCSYLLLGGLICLTFYYQGTEETRSNQQTTYCTVWNPCSAHDYHLKPTTTIVDGSRYDCIFVKSYAWQLFLVINQKLVCSLWLSHDARQLISGGLHRACKLCTCQWTVLTPKSQRARKFTLKMWGLLWHLRVRQETKRLPDVALAQPSKWTNNDGTPAIVTKWLTGFVMFMKMLMYVMSCSRSEAIIPSMNNMLYCSL